MKMIEKLILYNLIVHREIAEVDVDNIKIHWQDAKPLLLIRFNHELAIAHFFNNILDLVVSHKDLAVARIFNCLDQFILQIIFLSLSKNLVLKFQA